MKKNLLLLYVVLTTTAALAQLPSYVPTTGLLAWYPFSGNAQDISGNGHNGSISNTTLTTDRDGNANAAYSFNGGNSYIDCGNISELNNTSQITVCAWFNSSGNQSQARIISKEHYANNSDGWHIGYAATNSPFLEVNMSTNMSGGGINSTDSIHLGEWYHVALVFDGPASNAEERLKMYINGSEVPLSYNYPIPDLTSTTVYPLYIGNNYGLANINQWWGKIDDVGIWTVPLDSQQIADLYVAQDVTVGLEDAGYKKNSDLIIFPNPNSGMFEMNLANVDSRLLTVGIVDAQGRNVFSESLVVSHQQVNRTLDLSELVDGIYTVIVYSESGQLRTTRFVKSR